MQQKRTKRERSGAHTIPTIDTTTNYSIRLILLYVQYCTINLTPILSSNDSKVVASTAPVVLPGTSTVLVVLLNSIVTYLVGPI